MAAAKLEMPSGGKRAKMGTGRARSKPIGVWLDAERFIKLGRLAAAEGITRTTLIERWIDEHQVASVTEPSQHSEGVSPQPSDA